MPANTDTVARGCRETRELRPSAVASQDADAAITTNMDRGQLQTCATFSLVSGKTLQLRRRKSLWQAFAVRARYLTTRGRNISRSSRSQWTDSCHGFIARVTGAPPVLWSRNSLQGVGVR